MKTNLKCFFKEHSKFFKKLIVFLLICSFVLGIFIFFAVPSSAAEEPAENDRIIVPSGSYTWDVDYLMPYLDSSALLQLPFTLPPLNCTLNGVEGVLTVGDFNYIAGSWESDNHLRSFGYFTHLALDSSVPVYFNGNMVASALLLQPNTNGVWSTYVQLEGSDDLIPLTSIISGNDVSSYGRTIIVTEDTSVISDYATWFFNNTDGLPSSQSIIKSGYYKAKDSWNTDGFPAFDESIDFRYFDSDSDEYINASGISFRISSDIVYIDYYYDSDYISAYADGWNDDVLKYIEITDDTVVDEDFYFVFNNVFEVSSSSSNDYDIGYSSGFEDGVDYGYDIGYREGYASSSGNFFADIIDGVLGALDAFTIIGGFSLLDFLTTLLGGMALIWILKLLAGG